MIYLNFDCNFDIFLFINRNVIKNNMCGLNSVVECAIADRDVLGSIPRGRFFYFFF